MKNRKAKVLAGVLAVSIFTMAGSVAVGAEVNKNSKLASQAKITEEEALKTALDDAGLKEKEIDKSRVKLDYDDGVLRYDVEFYVGNEEYDYEINAKTGKITDMDYEIDDDFQSSSNGRSGAKVTEDEAKKTALAKVAGATEDDIRIHLDEDDGRLTYEGSIYYDDVEYEFKINADTGKIIEWDSESIWD